MKTILARVIIKIGSWLDNFIPEIEPEHSDQNNKEILTRDVKEQLDHMSRIPFIFSNFEQYSEHDLELTLDLLSKINSAAAEIIKSTYSKEQ